MSGSGAATPKHVMEHIEDVVYSGETEGGDEGRSVSVTVLTQALFAGEVVEVCGDGRGDLSATLLADVVYGGEEAKEIGDEETVDGRGEDVSPKHLGDALCGAGEEAKEQKFFFQEIGDEETVDGRGEVEMERILNQTVPHKGGAEKNTEFEFPSTMVMMKLVCLKEAEVRGLLLRAVDFLKVKQMSTEPLHPSTQFRNRHGNSHQRSPIICCATTPARSGETWALFPNSSRMLSSSISTEEANKLRNSSRKRNKFYDSLAADKRVPPRSSNESEMNPYFVFLMRMKTQKMYLEGLKNDEKFKVPKARRMTHRLAQASQQNDDSVAFQLGRYLHGEIPLALLEQRISKIGPLFEENANPMTSESQPDDGVEAPKPKKAKETVPLAQLPSVRTVHDVALVPESAKCLFINYSTVQKLTYSTLSRSRYQGPK
uniref:Uncharacterized protein n=1 Tax=Caenorhabditis japonica TaxID=281687 RepID=A0A8R1DJP3_CAEJA